MFNAYIRAHATLVDMLLTRRVLLEKGLKQYSLDSDWVRITIAKYGYVPVIIHTVVMQPYLQLAQIIVSFT